MISNIKKLLREVYDLTISGKQKAVAAALVTLVAAFLLQHFSLDISGWTALLTSLILAVLNHLAVYLKANK